MENEQVTIANSRECIALMKVALSDSDLRDALAEHAQVKEELQEVAQVSLRLSTCRDLAGRLTGAGTPANKDLAIVFLAAHKKMTSTPQIAPGWSEDMTNVMILAGESFEHRKNEYEGLLRDSAPTFAMHTAEELARHLKELSPWQGGAPGGKRWDDDVHGCILEHFQRTLDKVDHRSFLYIYIYIHK